MAKVVILQVTGGSGFPSTSGYTSGTFGTALRGTLRVYFKCLIVSAAKFLFAGTVPAAYSFLAGTVTEYNLYTKIFIAAVMHVVLVIRKVLKKKLNLA